MKKLVSLMLVLLFSFSLIGCGTVRASGVTVEHRAEPRYDAPRAIPLGAKQNEPSEVALSDARVGDTVTFGRYEQNNKTADGDEPIEWIVLDKMDNRLLLLSVCCLECLPYHAGYASLTWRSCTLRDWLEDEFIDTAFTDEEQALICSSKLRNQNNSYYSSIGGKDTVDRVFILSQKEANTLLRYADDRIAEPSSYALSIARAQDTADIGWYWLRTPGQNNYYFMGVIADDGSLRCGGFSEGCYGYVRPAMWVSCE